MNSQSEVDEVLLQSPWLRLYDGLLDEQDWRNALSQLCDQLGGATFHYLVLDEKSMQLLDGFAPEVAPQDKVHEYEAEHYDNDERLKLMLTLPVGQVMYDHQHFSKQDLSHSAIYSGWLHSVRLGRTMGLSLRSEAGIRECFGIMRAFGDAAFGEQEQAIVSHWLPHLLHASLLRSRLQQLHGRFAMGMLALDSLSQGIVVLNAQGQVAYLNVAAENFACASRLVRITQEKWQFNDTVLQNRFVQALGLAAYKNQPSVIQCEAPSALPWPTAGHDACRFSVLPLTQQQRDGFRIQAPAALLLITDPARKQEQHEASLVTVLGITPAEARLALLLASGKTVKHYALYQAISEHTARTHLKNLLRKTGCHRQLDVINLIQALIMN